MDKDKTIIRTYTDLSCQNCNKTVRIQLKKVDDKWEDSSVTDHIETDMDSNGIPHIIAGICYNCGNSMIIGEENIFND